MKAHFHGGPFNGQYRELEGKVPTRLTLKAVGKSENVRYKHVGIDPPAHGAEVDSACFTIELAEKGEFQPGASTEVQEE